MRRWIGVSVVVLIVLAGAVLSRGDIPCDVLETQPACYVALTPGPTADTLGILEIAGAQTYSSAGEMLLTTISVNDSLDLTSWARAVSSAAIETVPREQVYPTGIDRDDIRERNAASMADSQLTATIAALTTAGYDLTGEGARIVLIADDAVTDQLIEGDIIVGISDATDPGDVRVVADSTDVVEGVQSRSPGDTVIFDVLRGGENIDIEVQLGGAPDDDSRAYVGVLLTTEIDIPLDVVIDAGSIGGPSGGLIFAMSIVDVLGEEDLTGGAVIAGTGTVDRDGNVGSVGGVRQKVVGATQRRDGAPPATVFLVPRANFDDALGAPVSQDVTIVPIDDLEGALAALLELREGREPAEAMVLSAG